MQWRTNEMNVKTRKKKLTVLKNLHCSFLAKRRKRQKDEKKKKMLGMETS